MINQNKIAINVTIKRNKKVTEQIDSNRRRILTYIGGALIFPEIVFATPKRTLKIGQLELEIVDQREVPFPEEYVDPNNSGNPLIHVPESYLDAPVSENFRLGEFALIPNPANNKGKRINIYNDGGKVYHQFIRLDPELPAALQKLRKDFGSGLRILSPYRNFTYNNNCGGEKNSRHKSGQAADLRPNDKNDLARLYQLADSQFVNGGVGNYPSQGFVHVDVRGSRARWRR